MGLPQGSNHPRSQLPLPALLAGSHGPAGPLRWHPSRACRFEPAFSYSSSGRSGTLRRRAALGGRTTIDMDAPGMTTTVGSPAPRPVHLAQLRNLPETKALASVPYVSTDPRRDLPAPRLHDPRDEVTLACRAASSGCIAGSKRRIARACGQSVSTILPLPPCPS